MKNQNHKLNLCKHGFTFGYCADMCLQFASLKEKIAEDRRLFLKHFKQTPKSLKHLHARKVWSKMNPITKVTFIQKLLFYNQLERQVKY